TELSKLTGATAIQVDISNSALVNEAVNKILLDFKHIDVLINNAGIAQYKLFTDISDSDWNDVFNNNITGAFYVTRAVVPGMISNKKGKIINVSSMWGITGGAMEVHYSASKAAIIGFSKALAKELAPSGINVNCIAPGVIDTDMNSDLSNEDKSNLCNQIPSMRLGNPDEVADLMLFLASERSKYITGQVISIDGGYCI
ncbi:MAG: SDR family oxidoreductase, partial [Christensenellaceae bacterium]|nr:SDR family oxidoreductase [Christensenellaceae bacterium]